MAIGTGETSIEEDRDNPGNELVSSNIHEPESVLNAFEKSTPAPPTLMPNGQEPHRRKPNVLESEINVVIMAEWESME